MYVKTTDFNSSELAQFKQFQQRSYQILQTAAANLKSGDTEKAVAQQLVKDYYASGATGFFHLPVTLFGERTALPGQWSVGKFYPKKKMLSPGDSVILDASPIYDGFLVDTSYSFCFGQNDQHQHMMQHLSQYRDLILNAVNSGKGFRAIAETVNHTMIQHGFEPVHTKHIGEVLGHRAVKFGKLPWRPRIKGFDAFAISWFNLKDKLASSGLGKQSPLWNALKTSDHPPHDGLWLVEPHAGTGDVGAKWEEILVITKGVARWLEPTPPHVDQWRRIAAGQCYAPQA